MRIPLRFVVVMTLLASALPAVAQTRVSITVAPPPLPVYAQPVCPGDGYIWTPGYWAWDDIAGGYYWVPGTWLLPPSVGLLWTPGYWIWEDATFVFVDGYWGPAVGFYGGIDYGFGYPGHGYYGGRWTRGRFFYNRSVSNVDVTVVRNTYVENVEVNRSPNRVSYNGGKDGIVARPTAREATVAQQKDKQVAPTAAQTQHVQAARSMRQLHAAENKGEPPVVATDRPEALRDRETDAPRGESAPSQSPSQRAERSQGQSAPPQTRPQRPSANDGRRSAENGRSNEGGRPAQRGADAEPPPAAGRTQSSEDRSRDEQASRPRQQKKRDKEQEND